MAKEIVKTTGGHASPFERIRQVNKVGNEYWESRDLADVLGYTQYRNFEAVIEKAKLSCFNSGHRIEDHFADVSKMVETKQRKQLGKAEAPAKKKANN